jgi:hypothetical protein
MRYRRTILCLALLAALTLAPCGAQAQGRGLRHLKVWAGEYVVPVLMPGRPKGSIFNDPALRAALTRLMGARALGHMLLDFRTTAPASLADGFLIFNGNPEHDATNAYLVMVQLDSDTVWVAHLSRGSVEWYGPPLPGEAPRCLIEDFLPRRQSGTVSGAQ